jgi:hypothetical protein
MVNVIVWRFLWNIARTQTERLFLKVFKVSGYDSRMTSHSCTSFCKLDLSREKEASSQCGTSSHIMRPVCCRFSTRSHVPVGRPAP